MFKEHSLIFFKILNVIISYEFKFELLEFNNIFNDY